MGSSKKLNKSTFVACEAEIWLISFVRFCMGLPLILQLRKILYISVGKCSWSSPTTSLLLEIQTKKLTKRSVYSLSGKALKFSRGWVVTLASFGLGCADFVWTTLLIETISNFSRTVMAFTPSFFIKIFPCNHCVAGIFLRKYLKFAVRHIE